MFRAQVCAMGIGLMLAAASTQARELDFSVDTRMGGDNNVFRSSVDKKSDGYWELSPSVSLRDIRKKLNYEVNYSPSYTTYFETNEVDGFDHRTHGVLSWRPTPLDTIALSGSYRNVRLLRIQDVSAPTDPTPVFEENDRERYRRSNVLVSYQRALNERWSVQGSAHFDDYDYSRSDSIDSRGYSGELGTQYALHPRASVGMSGSFRRRESDSGVGGRPAETTDIWNLSGFVQYLPAPNWTILAQVGPSFFDTTQDFPSPLPDRKDQSTSYFATLRVEKDWRLTKASVAYSRSESAGGGTSSASILDDIRMYVDHRFDQRWSVRLAATWIKREEISAVAGQSKEETTQYLGFFTVTRRIDSRLSISGQYSVVVQDENQNVGTESIGAIHSGYVSLKYEFDPIVF